MMAALSSRRLLTSALTTRLQTQALCALLALAFAKKATSLVRHAKTGKLEPNLAQDHEQELSIFPQNFT